MKVNKNMVSGNTAMLILKLISEKDMYGYEMIDTLCYNERADNNHSGFLVTYNLCRVFLSSFHNKVFFVKEFVIKN